MLAQRYEIYKDQYRPFIVMNCQDSFVGHQWPTNSRNPGLVRTCYLLISTCRTNQKEMPESTL